MKEIPRHLVHGGVAPNGEYMRGEKAGESREREHHERLKAIHDEWEGKFKRQDIVFALTVSISVLAMVLATVALFR